MADDSLDAIAEQYPEADVSDAYLSTESRAEKGEQFGYESDS